MCCVRTVKKKAQLRAQGHVGEGVCLVHVEGSDRLAEVLYTDQAVLLLSDSDMRSVVTLVC